MKKFLRIVENNLPSQQEGEAKVLVDKLAELLDTIPGIRVESTSPTKELKIYIDGHCIVLTLLLKMFTKTPIVMRMQKIRQQHQSHLQQQQRSM